MSEFKQSDNPVERLSGSVERVTFHSEESGFCVLRTKVKGHRDFITVVGSAASVSPGEYIECLGTWLNDRTHGLQFKAQQLIPKLSYSKNGTSFKDRNTKKKGNKAKL